MCQYDDPGPQPSDINAKDHFWNAFDHTETEVSARWIVRFCQERGRGWARFTREEIEAFYARWVQDGFTFNRLLAQGFVDENPPGEYMVTDNFVRRCYRASPTVPAAIDEGAKS